MELIGIGIDMTHIDRLSKVNEVHRFAEYILSPSELAEYFQRKDPLVYLASRFSVKEAVIKSLPKGATWQDFQVIKNGEKPFVEFLTSKWGGYRVFVSISHDQGSVVGIAQAWKLD